jgi:hypothetical protein
MKTINIISRGVARCKYEPRGEHGLEGYVLNDKYQFERCENDSGKYIRVFHCSMNPDETTPVDFTPPFYYETCGTGVFLKFFEIISEQAV